MGSLHRLAAATLLLLSMAPPARAEEYQWSSVPVGGGGYVTGIAIHPTQADLIYIRTDVGGAYRWDPSGRQWIPILDWIGPSEANLIGVDGVALDPAVPDRVYLALGRSSGGDGGLYRSNDRGKTWTRLMTARFEGNGRDLRWSGECVAVDPRTSAAIYCGTRLDGLWRSLDGGTTWAKVAAVPNGYTGTNPTGVRAVVFDPAAATGGKSSTIYVGIPGSGIYRSTDGGGSFASMPGAPAAPRRMQVVGGSLYVTHSTGVMLWTGGAWRDVTPAAGAGKDYCALAVDPADSRKVVVCQRYSSFYNPMFRSTDAGASWQQINTSAVPATKHMDVPWWDPKRFSSATAGMVLDPVHPGQLYYTDWFGVWQTPNVWAASTDWYTLEKGHEETVVLTLVAPPSGALVYSGMADDFGFRHDSLTAYPAKKLYAVSEGFSIAVCEQAPANIAILGATAWGGDNTRLSTSADRGETWTDRTLPAGTTLGRIACSSTDPGRMVYVAGGGAAYYTADRGASWKSCQGAPSGAVGLTDIWNKDSALAADAVDGNRFYLFKSGILYASTDGGASWSAQNASAIPNKSGYLNVVPMPGKTGEVWVSLDGNGLWKTSDGGRTFAKVSAFGSATLFSWGAPASGRTNPTAYGYGTQSGQWGLYRSVDMGATWVRINDNDHQFPAGAKTLAGDRQVFGRVYVGSGGRGIFYGQSVASTSPPSAPTGLNSSAVSTSQVNLLWTDNAGDETGFKIERKTGSGGTWAQIATTGANVATYANTGLAASTTYYYRVRATNAAGDSGYSNEASATTATPAPSAPTGLVATAASASQINISWTDNAGNETGFKIERKTGSGGTYAQIATAGANVTSYSNTGLAASTTYYYLLRATNTGGDSGYSNEASATTQAAPPPPPPTGSGIGLRGEYFDNADFTTASIVRTDATVNFDWGSGSPDAALAVDSFSARWSGAVQPQYSETYTFFTTTDDGVRLWVDGKLLIDKWVDQGPTEWSGTVALTAGKKVDIRMDYYENGGGATAKLSWSSASRAKEIIPQAQLYPWSSRDIGSVGVAGSDSVSGSSFTVKGSGADIWNNADAFHYVYQVLTGDGEIKARVASVESTDPWAKAGVMVRESLNADARHAMAVMTPGYGFAFQRRTAVAGASATTGAGGISAPYWVRMVRQGNNFSAYRSADGNAWTWVGTETIGQGSPAYVGLAVTSHNNTVGCTAQIDNVTTATSVAPAGALVTVTYVSTSKPYSLATAKVGALPYIDRTYTITAMPSALNGGVLVRTANDDKGNTNSSHLTLRLGQAATVYVVYDKTGTLPAWMSGWTLRTDTVTTTDAGPSPMRVYQKSVAAGDLMLGGNLQSPASGSLDDYFVVVQPTSGKALPAGDGLALMASTIYAEGPIPADRWQHEGDTDGDGLRDDFEPGYALDATKPDTDGDGVSDEGVVGPDGRTLWEVQEGVDLRAAPEAGAAGGDGGGTGNKCGSFGLDLMAPLALLWLARRRRR